MDETQGGNEVGSRGQWMKNRRGMDSHGRAWVVARPIWCGAVDVT